MNSNGKCSSGVDGDGTTPKATSIVLRGFVTDRLNTVYKPVMPD